ncbi:MAG TPA: hypothetical protein VE007_10570 [Thermoanaerobaculia bacterium]|nr:hypothetical protein [Thermoanaerobaculia bacterium]
MLAEIPAGASAKRQNTAAPDRLYTITILVQPMKKTASARVPLSSNCTATGYAVRFWDRPVPASNGLNIDLSSDSS